MARTGFLVRRVDRGTFLHLLRQTDEVDGGLFRRRHARMETLVRKPGAILRRAADADRKGHERLDLEGNRAPGTPAFGLGSPWLRGPGWPPCLPPLWSSPRSHPHTPLHDNLTV